MKLWRELDPTASRLHPRRRCISRRAAFLARYRETASIRAAAEVAGIAQNQFYEWLERNVPFQRDFESAQQDVADSLQDQVVELAVQGWEEPVYYRGRQCGDIRHYSDRLLMLMLKAWKPDQYR
jgi:hypothetical protein